MEASLIYYPVDTRGHSITKYWSMLANSAYRFVSCRPLYKCGKFNLTETHLVKSDESLKIL